MRQQLTSSNSRLLKQRNASNKKRTKMTVGSEINNGIQKKEQTAHWFVDHIIHDKSQSPWSHGRRNLTNEWTLCDRRYQRNYS
jgi:hypothetical protein